MTKTPLGKVAPTPRGSWSAGATYTNLDIVRHDGCSFIVLRTVTGVTPSDDGENYRLLCADGGAADLSSYAKKTWVNDAISAAIATVDTLVGSGVIS